MTLDVSMMGERNWRIVTVGPLRLFFSYSTLVAVQGLGAEIRTDKFYSKTTSHDLTAMGCNGFPTMADDAFRAWVPVILASALGRGK